MEKNLFDSFNEIFESKLSLTMTREDSFEKAKEEFQSRFGWSGYRNYNSFKVSRAQRRRKRQ